MPTLGLIGHSQSVLQYNNPPVTQLDRVSGFYPECWEFEPLRADHGDVAQLVRAGDSYSQGRWFESTLHYQLIFSHKYINESKRIPIRAN